MNDGRTFDPKRFTMKNAQSGKGRNHLSSSEEETVLNLRTTALKNVQWFRGGLVLKSYSLLCHSTLGLIDFFIFVSLNSQLD